jgi:hypothetical protein
LPFLSHQVKLLPKACILLAGLTALNGCATDATVDRGVREVVQVPVAGERIRVEIYGDLLGRDTASPRQSWLEHYVFGPETVSRTPLRNPQGLTVHGNRVFVCDQGLPDIVTIDLVTGRLNRLTSAVDRPACPVDVAVDSAGQVYVADTTRDAVLIYDADGRLLTSTSPEKMKAGSNGFQPSALLMDGDRLLVGDAEDGRVWNFDPASSAWQEWTAAKGACASVTGLAKGKGGDLLLVDALRAQVVRRSEAGSGGSAIGRRGRAFGQFVRPIHASTSSSGHLLVTDAARQSLIIFDSSGNAVAEWPPANSPDAPRRWTLPMGVVCFRVDRPEVLLSSMGFANRSIPDEFALVSDALGPVSLTLIGLTYDLRPEGGM